MGKYSVVICGGGIAGLEGLLRLRRLAADRVDITLVCAQDDFVFRALSVLEAFSERPARRYPLIRIAADTRTLWLRDSLAWVDRAQHVVHTAGGQALRYDALLLAVGARLRTASPHVALFTARPGGLAYREILDGIDSGAIGSLVFVLPGGPTWPLPLFELALMTAARARETGRQVSIHVVIPSTQPTEALGKEAGHAVSQLMRDAGIQLHSAWSVNIPDQHHVIVQPKGVVLRADRIVSLPTVAGPNVRGIPGADRDGFLHVDAYCRVREAGDAVFAAGDATDLSVKHGSVGAQQADTAAAGIAHLAGAGPAAEPLRPVVHATLVTGREPLHVSAYLIAGQGWQATLHDRPPWGPDDKVVAEELGAYLRDFDEPRPQGQDEPRPQGQDEPRPQGQVVRAARP